MCASIAQGWRDSQRREDAELCVVERRGAADRFRSGAAWQCNARSARTRAIAARSKAGERRKVRASRGAEQVDRAFVRASGDETMECEACSQVLAHKLAGAAETSARVGACAESSTSASASDHMAVENFAN